MMIREVELNEDVIRQLISLSKDWAEENSCYGYRENGRADIEGNRIFIAEEGSTVIGYLFGHTENSEKASSIMPDGTPFFEVEELYVKPEYRSRGIGQKLFRFAEKWGQQVYGVLFWAVTVIDCDQDIENVRLAVGSNSASMWWLNGEEALLLSGDRRMVKDDAMSPRLTLKKGRNILRGAVINGPGMSDFCVRFLDENGNPVKNYSIKAQ